MQFEGMEFSPIYDIRTPGISYSGAIAHLENAPLFIEASGVATASRGARIEDIQADLEAIGWWGVYDAADLAYISATGRLPAQTCIDWRDF